MHNKTRHHFGGPVQSSNVQCSFLSSCLIGSQIVLHMTCEWLRKDQSSQGRRQLYRYALLSTRSTLTRRKFSVGRRRKGPDSGIMLGSNETNTKLLRITTPLGVREVAGKSADFSRIANVSLSCSCFQPETLSACKPGYLSFGSSTSVLEQSMSEQDP